MQLTGLEDPVWRGYRLRADSPHDKFLGASIVALMWYVPLDQPHVTRYVIRHGCEGWCHRRAGLRGAVQQDDG